VTLRSRRRVDIAAGAFRAFLYLSLAVGFASLGALGYQVVDDGLPFLDRALLTNAPSTNPDVAGARPAILATIYLMVLLIFIAVPIGVGTAVYLEEFADNDRWYNRLLEVNIQNLAAVPSIVYGILGLAFLVRGIGLGRVLLAGALILTLLVLPTIIIATREALRAVPNSIRAGGMALGATRLQVVRTQVLPAAAPGIATGPSSPLLPGIGETAPLIMVGALTYVAFNPALLGAFTALPIQIYQWISDRRRSSTLAAAGIMVPPGLSHDAERRGDLHPQPLSEEMVMRHAEHCPAQVCLRCVGDVARRGEPRLR
jgi:phosphate transport system permease protein